MRLHFTVGLLLFAMAGVAPAQSLSELAEKEKERRKAAAGAGSQTFTNDDLEKGKPAPTPSPSATAAPGRSGARRTAPTTTGTPTPRQPPRPGHDEGVAEDDEDAAPAALSANQPGAEASWRQQAQSARDAITAAEQGVAQAEKALGSVRTGISQPLPSDGLRQLPPNGLVKEASQESADRDLAAARANLERAKAAFADLEERARKASIPPGWLR